MYIKINVKGQNMEIAGKSSKVVDGSQRFVRFVFSLSDEWDNLKIFAQFRQDGKAYNTYLDNDNSVFLPAEIKSGRCDLSLYGSGGDSVIGTTGNIKFTVYDSYVISDASSTQISRPLYEQLLLEFKRLISGGMTDSSGMVSMSPNILDINNCEIIYDKYAQFTDGKQFNSKSMDIIKFSRIKPSTEYTINCAGYVCYFNSADVFLSAASSSNAPITFTTHADTSYVLISVLKTVDKSTIMIVEGKDMPQSYTPPGVSVCGIDITKAGEASQKVCGGAEGWVTANMTDFAYKSRNIFNVSECEITLNKYAQFTDGVQYGSQNNDIIKFSKIKPSTEYSINCACILSHFDSAGVFISGIGVGKEINIFKTPENTAYTLISVVKTIDKSTIMIVEGKDMPQSYEPSGFFIDGVDLHSIERLESDNNSCYGKNYLCFGDSFTHYNQGKTVNWTTWFKAAMQPNDFVIKAISGASYLGSGTTHVTAQVSEAIADKSIKPDVIFILCGANETMVRYQDIDNFESRFTDSNGDPIPLADIDKENDTIAAIRWCYETLMTTYPKAKIFLCTPTQEGKQGNGKWFRTYADTKAKRDAQIRLAERMSIEVIDTFNCGIYSNLWEKTIGDGIHPNEHGAVLIANMMINAAKKYFANEI